MRDELTKKHGKPLGNLLEVPLSKGDPNWAVQIGSDLERITKEWLTIILQENIDVFAWSTADKPGIDLDVMIHKLNINLTYCSVKQKK